MDCINPMQNKKRRSGELEQWHNQAKRLCNGLGGRARVEYGVVEVDTPMDTWGVPNHNPQNGHSGNVPGMVSPARDGVQDSIAPGVWRVNLAI